MESLRYGSHPAFQWVYFGEQCSKEPSCQETIVSPAGGLVAVAGYEASVVDGIEI